MNLKDALVRLPQAILPQHALSHWMSKLTHSQQPLLKKFLINQAIRHYGVNMNESLINDPLEFKSFNDFFTRQLKADARPINNTTGGIVCPADGVISQAGTIHGNQIFQAKGKRFDLIDLLGGDSVRANPFHNGNFATIYLSPKDYHRLHMPLTGKLIEMVHVPGRLFSVNASTAQAVDNLFAINERVVAIFDTECGLMALVLVGAIFVSSIEMVWQGVITPPSRQSVQSWHYQDQNIVLSKGEELGRFNMGSTIIAVFCPHQINFKEDIANGKAVKLGELIGVKADR